MVIDFKDILKYPLREFSHVRVNSIYLYEDASSVSLCEITLGKSIEICLVAILIIDKNSSTYNTILVDDPPCASK